jgi:16S rRNA (guanine966-N2)-methyltransferase
MRIISGLYKGKKILLPTDKNTRPLKDLTKESIFNLIIHSKFSKIDLERSNVLDLFAGSGSFGLECLSRKSNFVTFVENYRSVIKILKNNIKTFKIDKNYEIIEDDIFNNKFFQNINKKFDLIFLDPPYKEGRINFLLENIVKNKIINQKGLVILHRNKKTKELFSDKFKIVENRIYGISKIYLIKLR